MKNKIDVLFINPDSSKQAYQGLADIYSAIETPTWSLLLAESCRSKGYSVGILDCDAERLTLDEACNRIDEINPRLIVFVVYGQNPNSGTTNMVGAYQLSGEIKSRYPYRKIAFVGSHSSALPREVLSNFFVDFVFLNEGVYALHNLLRTNLVDGLDKVRGIGFKEGGINKNITINQPERVVPQDRMDIDLPGYAWDLLPMNKRPLDLYRAHFWHAGFNHGNRTPFAAIYTSLGCQFACDFCMINILNRVDSSEGITAAESRGMRFWSSEWVHREMDKLANLGVKTLRISDEMFFLNRKYYVPVLDNIINEGWGFNMWTYSRVDTVRKEYLELFKNAGVNWLALGIEAGNQLVRQEVSKGSFKEVSIHNICKLISESDINIISNYIFGFPEDNFQTMQETLDLALELNTEMANMYPCQALPGSPMHRRAQIEGWQLPQSFEAYGFLSYECQPLPTKYLSSKEVLKFRDEAWKKYFTNQKYLALIENKFGTQERINIERMAEIKLKRKILGDR